MVASISVIVIAHDRKKYLPRALHSIEAQTLDKDKFEVVVVKPFEDKASDDIISRNGWKNVIVEENAEARHVGGKVSVGVEESSGDIITILEDDDVYLHERLEVIYRSFKSNKSLIHFHNEYGYTDDYGRFLGKREGYHDYRELVVPDVIKHRVVDSYVKVTLATVFNSAIAIRRDVVEKRIDVLKRLLHIDPYLFYISLIDEGDLMATSQILTLKGINDLGRYHQLSGVLGGMVLSFIQYLNDLAIIGETGYTKIGCVTCAQLFALRTIEIAAYPNAHKLLGINVRPSMLPAFLEALKDMPPQIRMIVFADFFLQYAPDPVRRLYHYLRYFLKVLRAASV